jgi:hypothetical protein
MPARRRPSFPRYSCASSAPSQQPTSSPPFIQRRSRAGWNALDYHVARAPRNDEGGGFRNDGGGAVFVMAGSSDGLPSPACGGGCPKGGRGLRAKRRASTLFSWRRGVDGRPVSSSPFSARLSSCRAKIYPPRLFREGLFPCFFAAFSPPCIFPARGRAIFHAGKNSAGRAVSAVRRILHSICIKCPCRGKGHNVDIGQW